MFKKLERCNIMAQLHQNQSFVSHFWLVK